MAFSMFSLKDIKERLAIQIIEDQRLFEHDIKTIEISDYLRITLDEFTSLALSINTEKSRSEWIIAPVLAEVRRKFNKQISLFSGSSFTVDEDRGLVGQCDYIISLNPEQFYITAPIVIIVEAKKEDIIGGLGQCMATMFAADIFNKRESNPINSVHGAVTTGTTWKFMKLEKNRVFIDSDEYYIKEIELIMGILCSIIAPYVHELALQK